jgi:hypothetical protein
MFIDYISNYRDDLTDTNYAATLSQMCSEARAKVLSNTPDVTFDNPNLLKPAHLNKMANKKRKKNQDKENNNNHQSPQASNLIPSQFQTQLPQQHHFNFNSFDNQVNSQLFQNVQQFSNSEIIITPTHQNRNNTFSYITNNQDDTSDGFPLL